MSGSLAGMSAAAMAGGSERGGQVLQSVAAVSSASQAPTAAVSAASRVSMSQIQGVKKPLLHANSFTGERLPKYGIETCHEDELGKVLCLHGCVVVSWTPLECVSQRERVRSVYGIICSCCFGDSGRLEALHSCLPLPLPLKKSCNNTSVSGVYKYCVFFKTKMQILVFVVM